MKQYTMEKMNTDVQALWEGKCNAKLRQQRVLEGLQGLGSKGLLPWWWWSALPSPVCRGPRGAHLWGGALLASKQLPAHQLWPRRPRALPYPGPLHPLPHRGASQPCRVGSKLPSLFLPGALSLGPKGCHCTCFLAISAFIRVSSHRLAVNSSC